MRGNVLRQGVVKTARRILLVVAVMGLVGTVAIESANARERGTPGSTTRTAYCFERYLDCLAKVKEDCGKDYPTDPKGFTICANGGIDACSRSWGPKSDCQTRAREISVFPMQPKDQLRR